MPKPTKLFQGELILDDSNFARHSHALIGDGKSTITPDGVTRYLSAKPRVSAYGSKFLTFADSDLKLIPRSEWPARLKEQLERRRRVSDYCDFPAYNQASTNYCWANGPCQAASTQRRIQGLPYIQLSSASIAAKIKNFRNQGGWGEDACEYLQKYGACSVAEWPNAAISRSYDNSAADAARPNFKVISWVDCPQSQMFDYVMSACLQTLPGAPAYNWWGHLVMGCDGVEIERNSFGLRIRNSWDDSWGAKNELGFGGFAVYREGSKGTPSDYQIVHQVTQAFVLAT